MMEQRLSEIERMMTPDYELQERVIQIIEDELDETEIERVRYLMNRGTTKNNPKISWAYITGNGIEITDDHENTLIQLVQEHPL